MNNVAMLISTYDKSEDLWRPLESTFLKYWDDINLPIYLSTNHKSFKSQIFQSLKIGDELTWSDNLIKSLNVIREKYVLLTFDDLFLINKVDNVFFESLVNRAIKNNFNYLQFYRSISHGRRLDNMIFKKARCTRYKNSTIWSFWKKDVLLALLKKEENAWEFERNGNIRAYRYTDFYSTRINSIPFVNGIVKGRWNPLVKNKLKHMGLSISENRPTLTWYYTLYYKFRDMQFDFLTYLIHKIY